MSTTTHSCSILFTLLLALIFCALLAPYGVVGQTCYACNVTSCGGPFNSTNVTVQLPINSTADGAAACATFAANLNTFILTALGSTCQQSIAQFACATLELIASSEVGCNASTIGQNTPYANNASLFTTTCQSEVSCLGYEVESLLNEAGACSSFYNFYSAVIAKPTASALPCTQCNITACYNTAAYTGIPGPTVSFPAGSLPGIVGNACPEMNAVATALVNNPINASTAPAAIASTCGALAVLSSYDTTTQCNAGYVDELFDEIVFSQAASYNKTWQTFCAPFLMATFSTAVANSLIAAGYCVSPSGGLTVYGNQLVAVANSSTSSTGTSLRSSASSYSYSSTSSTGSSGNSAVSMRADMMVFAAVAAVIVTMFC